MEAVGEDHMESRDLKPAVSGVREPAGNRDYHVEFGALCEPLSVQLERQGLTVSDHAELMRIEIIAKAVATVTIHGLMSPSQSDRARKKLAARVWKIVRALAAPASPAERQG